MWLTAVGCSSYDGNVHESKVKRIEELKFSIDICLKRLMHVAFFNMSLTKIVFTISYLI